MIATAVYYIFCALSFIWAVVVNTQMKVHDPVEGSTTRQMNTLGFIVLVIGPSVFIYILGWIFRYYLQQ